MNKNERHTLVLWIDIVLYLHSVDSCCCSGCLLLFVCFFLVGGRWKDGNRLIMNS